MIPWKTMPLPAPPDNLIANRFCLLSDGALAVVWADRSQRQAQLAVLSEEGSSTPIPLPAPWYNEVDRFPDGRWLVVTPRTEGDQDNAMILDEAGSQRAAFCLGDGILHIRCAADGTIWVGYFDEGVFGDSVGAGGLVRFSPAGRPLWAYNAAERRRAAFIGDCYALSIVGTETWTYFLEDFPIVRLRDGHETQWRNNAVYGAQALAVEGRHVVLAGGYGSNKPNLHLLRLGDGTADLIGSVPCPQIEKADLVAGQGATIHVVKDGSWSRFTVSDVRSCFT